MERKVGGGIRLKWMAVGGGSLGREREGWVGENKYWILASAAAADPQGNELPTYGVREKKEKGSENAKLGKYRPFLEQNKYIKTHLGSS